MQLRIVIDTGERDGKTIRLPDLGQHMEMRKHFISDRLHRSPLPAIGTPLPDVFAETADTVRGKHETGISPNLGMMAQLGQTGEINPHHLLHLPADLIETHHRRAGQGVDISREDIVKNGPDILVAVIEGDVGVAGKGIEVIGDVMDAEAMARTEFSKKARSKINSPPRVRSM